MSSTTLASLKNLSAKDRKQIEQAQEMLGPDPSTMGPVKNTFWGNLREDLLFPYPEASAEETARCDALLARLDEYLRNEHPTFQIDNEQHIPEWVIQRLFDLGVLGMTIDPQYGGGGFGITSYNRVLERIGRTCGSSAVLVSAHQSIGCKALMLFGNAEQKQRFLPGMARNTLSAFCLSEPNVGCDAGGQETTCQKSPCGSYFTINGEKKWATSGALSGLFTVMAKQKVTDPKTGKVKEGVTALICTPDMPGVEIFSRNRSKCGIRGTWQARIRLTNVKVPIANLLHHEGRGLVVALNCLNFGRCTLSAGMLGGATFAMEQAGKWAQSRYQFERPLAEFDLVRERLARMSAWVYAMDAMLYMTTGFLDRKDEDIMLETACCKVFCSEWGWRVVDDAMQIMGGESYMTENSIERIWRDSRINTIVEGANEVMHSFVFAYGSKQLGEWMLALRAKPTRQPGEALKIAGELFLGIRRSAPAPARVHERLAPLARELASRVQEHAYQVKCMFKEWEEKLVTEQTIQFRLSMCAIMIHAMSCTLSKVDRNLRRGLQGAALDREMATVEHLFALAGHNIDDEVRRLRFNTDETMKRAATVMLERIDQLPDSDYSIAERSPTPKRGQGYVADQTHIPQFGAGSTATPAAEPIPAPAAG